MKVSKQALMRLTGYSYKTLERYARNGQLVQSRGQGREWRSVYYEADSAEMLFTRLLGQQFSAKLRHELFVDSSAT